MPRPSTSHIALLSALLALACAPALAPAASRLTIRGAGYGHGVGMSQYGAYGLAEHGRTHREILAHYYTGTDIGALEAGRTVRVLLQSARGSARFSGARRAAGRRLNPRRTYSVRRGPGGTVELLSPRGRRLARVAPPLVAKGGASLVLRGRALNDVTSGAYRGTLEFRPGTYLGVMAVNAVGLEDYLRGVVARESPAHWPLEALKAQAVAARTYAVTTSKDGSGFEHYPDVRSQVYHGVAGEHPRTDEAVAATAGEIVTYEGRPVVTYFFSTSGGRTENVENTSLGHEPKPWLKSVEDPYDELSPKHRWGPIRMSLSRAGRKLAGLVKGSFRGIEVIRRGRSPRIVAADIVGSRGRTRVDGATLRARLGLYDTWAYFTSIVSGEEPKPKDVDGGDPPADGDPTGGSGPGALGARRRRSAIAGRVLLVRSRGATVLVERREGRRWTAVGVAPVRRHSGRYAFRVAEPGVYRVRFRGVPGPLVRIRPR